MKQCSKCKEVKPLEEFNNNRSKKDGKAGYCKECHKKYVRAHYIKNKKYYINKKNKRKAEIRAWFKEYKKNLKCSRCPEDHWVTLEFHHIETETKEINMFEVYRRGWGQKRIMEEVNKCEILCANCHRKHHCDD